MMKNFLKYGAIPFAFITLLFAGCADLMAPPEATGQGLQITISDGTQGRTLYPDAAFSKYVVSFENTDGDETHEVIDITTIQGGVASVTVIGLAAGTWKITVTGFVRINLTPRGGTAISDDFEVASGSQTVTIDGSGFQSANITIQAQQYGANTGADKGYFSYNVSRNFGIPIDADKANLYLYSASGSSFNTAAEEEKVNLNQTSNIGTIALDPGFYLMVIQIEGSDNQVIARTEAVHIYANMETNAAYTFTDSDFIKYVTVKGNVNITVGGLPPSNVYSFDISAYLDPECYGAPIYSDSGASIPANYSMKLASFSSARPVYLRIDMQTSGGGAGGPMGGYQYERIIPISVGTSDVTHNISLAFNRYVTVSGRIYSDDDVNLDSGYVEAYNSPNYSYSNWIGGASFGFNGEYFQYDSITDSYYLDWSLEFEGYSTPTIVYFVLDITGYGSGPGGGQVNLNKTVQATVGTQDVQNINFDFSSNVTLSGKVTLTGTAPANSTLLSSRVNAYYEDGYHISHSNVDTATGNWEIKIPAFTKTTSVVIQAEVEYGIGTSINTWGDYDDYEYYSKQTTVQVYDSNVPNINLTINLTRAAIGGTVTVNVNTSGLPAGAELMGILLAAFSVPLADAMNGNGDMLGSSMVVDTKDGIGSSTQWGMSIDADYLGKRVYFIVEAMYMVQTGGAGGSFEYYMGYAQVGTGTNIPSGGGTNIVLGTVTISSFEQSGGSVGPGPGPGGNPATITITGDFPSGVTEGMIQLWDSLNSTLPVAEGNGIVTSSPAGGGSSITFELRHHGSMMAEPWYGNGSVYIQMTLSDFSSPSGYTQYTYAYTNGQPLGPTGEGAVPYTIQAEPGNNTSIDFTGFDLVEF